MSWLQGVLTREEMPPAMIERLERGYANATGETDSVEYITWFDPDRSNLIAHFAGGRGFRVGVR